MSTTTPVPTVPKVRTFAADLTEARSLRDISPAQQPVVTSVPVIPKNAAAPVLTPTPAPIKNASAVALTPSIEPSAHTSSKTIPPFHTFEKPLVAPSTAKKTTAIDTSSFAASAPAVKASVLASPGVEPLTVDSKSNPADSGTVISDTKRKRSSLRGIIAASLHDWQTAKQKKIAGKKQPTYMIPDADRRKGVIQKAVSQTGRDGTADHAAALGRIRAAQKITRGTPVATSAPIKAEPTVEPFAETDILPVHPMTPVAIEGASPVFVVSTPVAEQSAPKQKTEVWDSEVQAAIDSLATTPLAVPPVIRPVVPVKTTAEPITPTTPSLPIPSAAAPVVARILPTQPKQTNPLAANRAPEKIVPTTVQVVPAVRTPIVVTPITRTPIIPTMPTLAARIDTRLVQVPTPATVEPVVTPDVIPNWAQSFEDEISVQRPEPRFAPPRTERAWWQTIFQQTNYLTLGALGVGGVGVAVWFIITLFSTEITVLVVAENLLPSTSFNGSVVNTPGGNVSTKEALAAAVQSSATTEQPLTEVPIRSVSTGQPLTATEFFALIKTDTAVSFSESLTRIAFGTYRGEPWLLFTLTDKATAQGGMFNWEKTMSRDLAPLFGAPVVQASKSGITAFHDAVVSGRDVRVLTDGSGVDRIIYGFISPNELLVTTSTAAFLNLADK